MSHLKFNVDLVRALIKKGTCYIPKATMVRASIFNPRGWIILCNGYEHQG
jgi:hypothetical protein